jgi:tetratricopeptide (TPR) repeat protein
VQFQRLSRQPKVFKFNPGFQSDEDAVHNFVVRRPQFQEIVDALVGRAPGARPYIVVIAPRGAGKTTLCRRVLAEIPRTRELNEKWHPIFLGEESYAVTTPGEFFLECVFHLQERSPEGSLEDQYEAALQLSNEKELVDRALGILRDFSTRTGKRLLIIVENFHVLLDEQIGSAAKQLLDLLLDEKDFGVLATSVSRWDIENQGQVPAGFIEVPLRPLSLLECQELWKALTDHDVPQHRVRPLQILTGGSPRLLHILAEFMRTPSLRNLMDNLNLLIDQNTEYFKSQLDALPSLERKVFVALLDAWDPCTAKQVGESARVNTNIASAMLARLTSRGSVIKELGRGRTSIYYAAERLFNIYYLMRRRSHPSTRVYALVSFMTDYYDRDELIDTAAILAREACSVGPDSRSEYHSTFDALLSKVPKAIRAGILERTPAEFRNSFQEHWQAAHGAAIFASSSGQNEELTENGSAVRSIVARARRAMERDDLDEAFRLLASALETHPESGLVLSRLALVYLRRGQFEEMLRTAKHISRLKEHIGWGHAFQGLALSAMNRMEEAKDAFARALELEPDHPIALTELAELNAEAGDQTEALKLYARGYQCGTLTDSAVAKYAWLLIRAGKGKKAETILRSEAKNANSHFSRRALAEFLSKQGREKEAEELLRRAARSSVKWQAWADLGFFLSRQENMAAAEDALKRSIERGCDEPGVYIQLASCKLDGGADKQSVLDVAGDLSRRFSSNPQAWIAAGLIFQMAGSTRQAENSMMSAIEGGGGAPAWLELGRMLALEPTRTADAERALRKAIELSEGPYVCAPSRQLAELLVHAGKDDAARAVLQSALEKNKQCYCCTVAQAEIAARHGHDDLARKWYETALEIDHQGIQALTGLARCVNEQEARGLIERALETAPRDPRCLLARARINQSDIAAQIVDAGEAIKKDPSFIEAHLFLIPLLIKQGKLDEAILHSEAALNELPKRRELIPLFVATSMEIADAGGGDRLSTLIDEHEHGSSVEPLAVALRLKRGERPLVAKEILAVAEDIAERSRALTANLAKQVNPG